MTNALRVLEPGMSAMSILVCFVAADVNEDGTERQIIKDTVGNMPRPKIRACSISGPLCSSSGKTTRLGCLSERRSGERSGARMSPMGDKVLCMVVLSSGSFPKTVWMQTSRYIAGCFFLDNPGLFQGCLTQPCCVLEWCHFHAASCQLWKRWAIPHPRPPTRYHGGVSLMSLHDHRILN
jgi:cleavage and polyadenylation specificity factor subunit 1